jgi:hypothetical protein
MTLLLGTNVIGTFGRNAAVPWLRGYSASRGLTLPEMGAVHPLPGMPGAFMMIKASLQKSYVI